MKNLLLLSAGFLISAQVAFAENPTFSSLKVTFLEASSPAALSDGNRNVIRSINTFDIAVEDGGTCEVELGICVSPFAPRGEAPDPDSRVCNLQIVGSKTVSAGSHKVRFRTRVRPMRERADTNGRQVSLQTRSTCTDSLDNVVVIESDPRARKASSSDGDIGPGKFVDLFAQNLR